MTQLFLKVINMSISASWLVLAVLVLRLILKKAPKWTNMMLWGIVAARLICPFSIESAMSLIPSKETVSPQIMTDWTPQIDTGFTVLNESVNPFITETFAPPAATSANPLQILIPVAALVWGLGILLLLMYTLVSYWMLRRKLNTAVSLRYNIFQSEYVTTPFVLGIFRPKIYLPFSMSRENIIYVISHEKAHIRHRDHWWKPFGFLLMTIHWFNPLMWLAYKLFSRDIELACDESVIRNMNSDQRADYAQALLTCSSNRKVAIACPIAFGEVGVRARIRSVLDYRKPTFWIVLAALVAGVAVAVCFLTDPKPEKTAEILTIPSETAQTEETAAAETEETVNASQEKAVDLAYFMEQSAPGKEFRDMRPEKWTEIMPEYGGLLDDFDIVARESTDGALSYIVGCWDGVLEESPLYHIRSSSRGDENGEVQLLYDERELEAAEKYEEPEYKYIIHNSHINHSSQTGYFLIHPTDAGWGFNDVFNKYLRPNGREYMLDALARGIAIGDPEGPYLEVSLISPQWGEIYEKIPLTQQQVEEILAQPRHVLPDGHGFVARLEPGPNSALNLEWEALSYTEIRGIPQTVLDLAVEKCGYTFATPKDIQNDIVEAKLECNWLEEPVYADASDLPLLQSILQNAEFGYIGGCGYGAKLTISVEDGSEMVLFKGTDGCDTMAFGSYGGYFIGDAENDQFWNIFGIDIGASWG